MSGILLVRNRSMAASSQFVGINCGIVDFTGADPVHNKRHVDPEQ